MHYVRLPIPPPNLPALNKSRSLKTITFIEEHTKKIKGVLGDLSCGFVDCIEYLTWSAATVLSTWIESGKVISSEGFAPKANAGVISFAPSKMPQVPQVPPTPMATATQTPRRAKKRVGADIQSKNSIFTLASSVAGSQSMNASRPGTSHSRPGTAQSRPGTANSIKNGAKPSPKKEGVTASLMKSKVLAEADILKAIADVNLNATSNTLVMAFQGLDLGSLPFEKLVDRVPRKLFFYFFRGIEYLNC